MNIRGGMVMLDAELLPEADAEPPAVVGRVITALAELPPKALLDGKALAQALGLCPRTVRRMVGRFELPPPISFGGRSTWQVEKVLAYFEARADQAARQAARAAAKLGNLLGRPAP